MRRIKSDLVKFELLGESTKDFRAKTEYSALCRRGEIPYYILSALSKSARQDLHCRRANEGSVIRTDLPRPLRIFLDNGLEFRLVEASGLITSTIYHVPLWAADDHNWALMTRETGSAGRPGEILIETRLTGWPEIEDPDMSAHDRIVAISRRQKLLHRSDADISGADCIDASGFNQRKLLIALPEATIALNRRDGEGLYWGFVRKRHPEGACWLGAPGDKEDHLRPYLYGGGSSVSEKLPIAARRVNDILAGLPVRKRLALTLRRLWARARRPHAESRKMIRL